MLPISCVLPYLFKLFGGPATTRLCGKLAGDDGFSYGKKRQFRKLDVLPGEGNAYDGHGESRGCSHMGESYPYSGKKKPYDIAYHAGNAGADIVFSVQKIARNGFIPEGQEGESGHDEACAAPGKTDDAHACQYSGEKPQQRHEPAAEYDPEYVADDTHEFAFFPFGRHCRTAEGKKYTGQDWSRQGAEEGDDTVRIFFGFLDG